MKPDYDEFLSGSTRWNFTRNGVDYSMNFHGYREPSEEFEGHAGTWAYYLLIPEQMFPHRWADFACVRNEYGFFHHGPAFRAVEFDSEITWSSNDPYYSRKEKREFALSRVGCDYNHSWHRYQGYPQTFNWVKRDAERTVDSFIDAHPDRLLRCDYSHTWDEASSFYTARNARMIHKSQQEKIAEDGWDGWLPAAMEAGR